MIKLTRGLRSGGIALLLAGMLGACDSDDRILGEYGQTESGIWFTTLDFKFGGRVTLKTSGSSADQTGTYQRNGNQVRVNVAGENRTLTLDDNGCLSGGEDNRLFSGVICKKS